MRPVLLRPVTLDDSALGHPLPWDLYNAAGTLLAPAGLRIADTEQLRRLMGQPLFRKPDALHADDNPALRLRDVADALATLLSGPNAPGMADTVLVLARRLEALYFQDPEALLGLVRLVPMDGHALRHCLHCALVATAIAENLGWSDRRLDSLVAATLTMNLSEMELHEHLALGVRTLGEGERQAIRTHPARSTEILVSCGVVDRDWLAAVLAHHEHLDGSGYPTGLVGDQIPQAARILRAVDYYCAKIGGRHYRSPRSPEQALRSIFGPERQHLDMNLAAHLVRRMGLYPPGTLLRLANRETAVVSRRPGRSKPLREVVSFLDYRGRVHERPQVRDITHHATAIVGPAEFRPDWAGYPWERLWGY